MSPPKDLEYYNLLEVGADATNEEIKKAYRRLAKIYHPDRHAGQANIDADAKFQELHLAFSTLSDVNKRAAYDRYGKEKFEENTGQGEMDLKSTIESLIKLLFGSEGFEKFLGSPTSLPEFKSIIRTLSTNSEEGADDIQNKKKSKDNKSKGNYDDQIIRSDHGNTSNEERVFAIEETAYSGHPIGAKGESIEENEQKKMNEEAIRAKEDEAAEEATINKIRDYLCLLIPVDIIGAEEKRLFEEKWEKLGESLVDEMGGYELLKLVYYVFNQQIGLHEKGLFGFKTGRFIYKPKSIFHTASQTITIAKEAYALLSVTRSIDSLQKDKEQMEKKLLEIKALAHDDVYFKDVIADQKSLKVQMMSPIIMKGYIETKLANNMQELDAKLDENMKTFASQGLSTVWMIGKYFLENRLRKAVDLFLSGTTSNKYQNTDAGIDTIIDARCKYLQIAAKTLRTVAKRSDQAQNKTNIADQIFNSQQI